MNSVYRWSALLDVLFVRVVLIATAIISETRHIIIIPEVDQTSTDDVIINVAAVPYWILMCCKHSRRGTVRVASLNVIDLEALPIDPLLLG